MLQGKRLTVAFSSLVMSGYSFTSAARDRVRGA